jgi:hypothetical protein
VDRERPGVKKMGHVLQNSGLLELDNMRELGVIIIYLDILQSNAARLKHNPQPMGLR